MSLFAELKRRNVLRLAAAYVVTAWLIIQVVETIFPAFGFGDAAVRLVVIVLAIGLIPTVILAWAFELTPEGLKLDRDVDPDRSFSARTGKRLDRMIMVVLALALGYFAFDKFVLDPARDQDLAEAAREAGRVEAVRESRDGGAASGPPMLAVLPFAAVGGGEDSTFFAAGVHDDLLTKLAQQPSLRVISRTSVLEYRDTERNIRDIGQALGAEAILEGGVQTSGERIRINAQLIDARTDEHLWAETYDRELTASNLFDVQAEIADAISTALTGTIGAQTTARRLPTTNMAAYRAYHEALALSDEISDLTAEPYRDLLRKAGTLDPEYTRPWAELVGSLALSNFGREDPDPDQMAEIEQALAHIHAVAPGSADDLIAQAYFTYYIIKDYELALDVATQAQALAPSDPRLVDMRSWIERRLGDFDARVGTLRLARELDPRNPRWTGMLIWNLKLAHRYDEAWAEFEGVEDPDYRMAWLGAWLRVRAHRDLGRLAAEMEALHEEYGDQADVEDRLYTRLVNREFEAAETLLAELPVSDEPARWHHVVIPHNTVFELELRRFLGQEQRLAALVADTRARLADYEPDGSLRDGRALLVAALLEALEGDAEETERLIRRWYREEGDDWPERSHNRDRTCQILGLAGAAKAAVECIRTGLREPSHVEPYLEPMLPYYDGIREHPDFVDLVEELG